VTKTVEVIIVPDEESAPRRQAERNEQGVDIPLERINPATLRNLVAEFVTREWEEIGDAGYSLDDKISQVLVQLQDGQAKVAFDLETGTCNIVSGDSIVQHSRRGCRQGGKD